MNNLIIIGNNAKKAAKIKLDNRTKNKVLEKFLLLIEKNKKKILFANKKDILFATKKIFLKTLLID